MNKLETFPNVKDYYKRFCELLEKKEKFEAHYDPDKEMFTI